MTGPSTQGIKTVAVPVSDLATAKAVYTVVLGVPAQTSGGGPSSWEIKRSIVFRASADVPKLSDAR